MIDRSSFSYPEGSYNPSGRPRGGTGVRNSGIRSSKSYPTLMPLTVFSSTHNRLIFRKQKRFLSNFRYISLQDLRSIKEENYLACMVRKSPLFREGCGLDA